MHEVQPEQAHASHHDWPAGGLMPEPGYMRQWAWKALRAAREEIHLAVESVMEDFDGLSGGCRGDSGRTERLPTRHPTEPSVEEVANEDNMHIETRTGGVDEDVSLRVADLVTPSPTREEYEEEHYEPPAPWTDHGFEIIDWERETQISNFDDRADLVSCR